MKIHGFPSRTMLVLGFASGALAPATAAAQSAQPGWEPGKWQFAASINGFIPAIDQTVLYGGDTRSSDVHVSMRDVLRHLQMTFQGSLDVHTGRWGIFNDVFYGNLGGVKSRTREFSIGDIGLPFPPARRRISTSASRPRSGPWPASTGWCPTLHGPWTCWPARAC